MFTKVDRKRMDNVRISTRGNTENTKEKPQGEHNIRLTESSFKIFITK